MHLDNLEQTDSSFLRGCLLGDGWLGLQRKKFVHLRIGHSTKQHAWLMWKADRLNRIFNKQRRVLGPYNTSDSKGNIHPSYLYCVDDHALLTPWFNRWYKPQEGKKTVKTVTSDFLDGLDLQALAIFWCDDGSLWHSRRVKKHSLKSGEVKNYHYLETRGSLATCCFSLEENNLIADWVTGLTGVKPKISRSKGYLLLRFNKSDLLEFIPKLAPYVPDCMRYKVDLSPCFK